MEVAGGTRLLTTQYGAVRAAFSHVSRKSRPAPRRVPPMNIMLKVRQWIDFNLRS